MISANFTVVNWELLYLVSFLALVGGLQADHKNDHVEWCHNNPFPQSSLKSAAVHQYPQKIPGRCWRRLENLRRNATCFMLVFLNTRPELACSPVASASSTSTKTGAKQARSSLHHKIRGQICVYIYIYSQLKVKGSIVFKVVHYCLVISNSYYQYGGETVKPCLQLPHSPPKANLGRVTHQRLPVCC